MQLVGAVNVMRMASMRAFGVYACVSLLTVYQRYCFCLSSSLSWFSLPLEWHERLCSYSIFDGPLIFIHKPIFAFHPIFCNKLVCCQTIFLFRMWNTRTQRDIDRERKSGYVSMCTRECVYERFRVSNVTEGPDFSQSMLNVLATIQLYYTQMW